MDNAACPSPLPDGFPSPPPYGNPKYCTRCCGPPSPRRGEGTTPVVTRHSRHGCQSLSQSSQSPKWQIKVWCTRLRWIKVKTEHVDGEWLTAKLPKVKNMVVANQRLVHSVTVRNSQNLWDSEWSGWSRCDLPILAARVSLPKYRSLTI